MDVRGVVQRLIPAGRWLSDNPTTYTVGLHFVFHLIGYVGVRLKCGHHVCAISRARLLFPCVLAGAAQVVTTLPRAHITAQHPSVWFVLANKGVLLDAVTKSQQLRFEGYENQASILTARVRQLSDINSICILCIVFLIILPISVKVS